MRSPLRRSASDSSVRQSPCPKGKVVVDVPSRFPIQNIRFTQLPEIRIVVSHKGANLRMAAASELEAEPQQPLLFPELPQSQPSSLPGLSFIPTHPFALTPSLSSGRHLPQDVSKARRFPLAQGLVCGSTSNPLLQGHAPDQLGGIAAQLAGLFHCGPHQGSFSLFL